MDSINSASEVPLAERLLLVEDDEADVQLFRRLLAGTGEQLGLDIVTDGETAVGWLTEKLAEARCGHPALPKAIFIDLKLPGMLGMDVLRWIRSVPELDRTFVAVCSAYAQPRDIDQARDLHADLYVPKYPSPQEFAALLAMDATANSAAEVHHRWDRHPFRQLEHAGMRKTPDS